jgi:predicted nucleotide-binding protein
VTRILDQQFVVHLFAPARSSRADAAGRAVREIWRGCEALFGMTAPVDRAGLPADMPDADALRTAAEAGDEVPLAARARPGTACQALLRLHHDVLTLSVGLAPPEASHQVAGRAGASAGGAAGDWPWWRDLDFQWNLLLERHAAVFLGEARLFLARVDPDATIQTADPALYAGLAALLPAAPGAATPEPGLPGPAVSGPPPPATVGVPFPDGFAVWDADVRPDDRATRRLVIAIAPDADSAASAWAWSPGRTAAIPPLARYLLHAAKLRYEARVWRRDSQAMRLRESLDALSAEFRRTGDPATLELLRLRQMDAVLLHSDLLAMRSTVEIAADNLGRALGLCGGSATVLGSLFADDAALASSLRERLEDEAGYLAIAAERAEKLAGLQALRAGPSTAAPPSAVPARAAPEDKRRNVFVVYGRDAEARRAVFDFLRSLGLHPLEWEELVKETGKMGPFLYDTVRAGLAIATAAVVLLTPEDVVHLHPNLREPGDGPAETSDTLQARPNVLLELGMAMAAKPDATLILIVGEHRTVTDLGGMSYVTLSGDSECRIRIADRLQVAGCAVSRVGTDWLRAGDFAHLAALHRTV